MNNLKELTWEHHKNAERQQFVKHLMGGSIDPKLYATYLWNQFPCYEVLEVMARAQGLLDDFPHIMRSKSILADFRELWPQDEKPPEHTMATKKYLAHMKTIMNDADKLMAHVYVRHMHIYIHIYIYIYIYIYIWGPSRAPGATSPTRPCRPQKCTSRGI